MPSPILTIIDDAYMRHVQTNVRMDHGSVIDFFELGAHILDEAETVLGTFFSGNHTHYFRLASAIPENDTLSSALAALDVVEHVTKQEQSTEVASFLLQTPKPGAVAMLVSSAKYASVVRALTAIGVPVILVLFEWESGDAPTLVSPELKRAATLTLNFSSDSTVSSLLR